MTVVDYFVLAQAGDQPADEATTRTVVEVVDLSGGGPLRRVVRLLLLRSRVVRARRRLRRLGATAIGSYAFYPDLEAPTFVYDLGGTARRYVEGDMLPGRGRLRTLGILVVAALAGCDPRAGGVVVVGRR